MLDLHDGSEDWALRAACIAFREEAFCPSTIPIRLDSLRHKRVHRLFDENLVLIRLDAKIG